MIKFVQKCKGNFQSLFPFKWRRGGDKRNGNLHSFLIFPTLMASSTSRLVGPAYFPNYAPPPAQGGTGDNYVGWHVGNDQHSHYLHHGTLAQGLIQDWYQLNLLGIH